MDLYHDVTFNISKIVTRHCITSFSIAVSFMNTYSQFLEIPVVEQSLFGLFIPQTLINNKN